MLAKKISDISPADLNYSFLCNSGSEANELALRLARTYTGSDEIIVLDCAYHGNTNYLTDISPYKFDGPGGNKGSPHAHKVSTPDIYRGSHRGSDGGERYAEEIKKCIQDDLGGKDVAAFICETLPGVGGQIVLPDNYLKHAFKYVRDAGGLVHRTALMQATKLSKMEMDSVLSTFEERGTVNITSLEAERPQGGGRPKVTIAWIGV